ncbi:hypothetical protein EDD18DRAFT_1191994 [Armillaria luteobubalina]|uniref:Uncharacterized protein n=1 Tax=Armillaria luteobubalina TaxID=153913 RepID=A0AA39UG70_9AGAR|nr:hypothetical protein EDD18DRAFT_1191994 [Armillaria luteobubalina]
MLLLSTYLIVALSTHPHQWASASLAYWRIIARAMNSSRLDIDWRTPQNSHSYGIWCGCLYLELINAVTLADSYTLPTSSSTILLYHRTQPSTRTIIETIRVSRRTTTPRILLDEDLPLSTRINFLLAYKELEFDVNLLDAGCNPPLKNYVPWLEEGNIPPHIFVGYRVMWPVHLHLDAFIRRFVPKAKVH